MTAKSKNDVGKKNSKSKTEGEQETRERILTEHFMDEYARNQKRQKAQRESVAPVIVEIIDDLRALIYKGGKLLAQPECGDNPDLFQIERNGYELIRELIGFLWLCQAPELEDGMAQPILPTQLTKQHVREFYELDESETKTDTE